MPTVVAIHQPNFFPWLGWFDKLARADVFIVLDHVQFQKTQGNWGNRVQLLVGGKPKWTTAPVRRDYHGVRSFSETILADDEPWRKGLLQTLRTNYGKAAAFHEVFSAAEPLIQNPISNLADFNAAAIGELARRMRIDPAKMVRSSTLNVEGQATDLLIDLIKAVGGTIYLCGGGSGGYLEPEKFAEAEIELLEQAFRHPVFQQGKAAEFTPGLSCLDALMHCGFDRVAEWFERKTEAKKAA
jgi:hypothetical protein